MIIPEVNPEHLSVISAQRKNRNWKGCIVVKPNCSIQCYVPLLKAWEAFEPKKVLVSTYQAISGAGKNFETWPEMIDNVIPFIGGEEEKSEKEPLKVLGKDVGGKIENTSDLTISTSCIRVPVSDGHMASVAVEFGKPATRKALIAALAEYKNPIDEYDLPSAPKPFITYFPEDNRPQGRLDRDRQGGMGLSVGRLREDPILGFKCVALSHNTLRGAAGGGVLSAELLVAKGFVTV
jgi:aspartate-semialdehyde dehydrogenase